MVNISSSQDKSIKFFLRSISDKFSLNTKIIDEPDKRIRNSEACDAIAVIGNEIVAIEHTSIDSYKNQREENALFFKFFKPIKEELEKRIKVPGKFQISTGPTINLKGFDYDKARAEIIKWCLENIKKLEVGSPNTAPHHFKSKQLPGVPFEIMFYRWPGKNGVQLANSSFDEIKPELQKVLKDSLYSRGKKVAKYRKDRYRTVLLLESDDIQLLNDYIVTKAFFELVEKIRDFELPDEIYLIMSGFENYELYCLKFDEDYSLEINSLYIKYYRKIYK